MARYDLMQKGSQPTVVVASTDAPAKVKAVADYVCDGTADQTEINAAIDAADAAGGRGCVELTGGRFYGSASVIMRTGVHLKGQGRLTELRAVGTTGVTGLIVLADANTHLTVVSDLYMEGNYASGGTCSAFRYDNTGGSMSGYPDSNPDADHQITDLFIHGFDAVADRHGIWMMGDNRGTIVNNIQIREIRGWGVYFQTAPDSHITNVHAGGCDAGGFNLNGGNLKLVNCKAFYCDVGFVVNSQRSALVACEAQDNRTHGFRFLAGRTTAAGLIADSNANPGGSGVSSVTGGSGIEIASSYNSIMGFSSFDRAANATPQQYGVKFTSGTNNQVVGCTQSNQLGDTTGTHATTASFVRISGSGGLVTAG